MKRSVIVLLCLVCLLGCSQAQDHGSLMLGSGFKQWKVDSDKEKVFFAKHPTDKIMTYRKVDEDKVVHVYKDPDTGVVYVGDQDALQAYLQKTQNQGMSPKPQEEGTWDPEFWTMYKHGPA